MHQRIRRQAALPALVTALLFAVVVSVVGGSTPAGAATGTVTVYRTLYDSNGNRYDAGKVSGTYAFGPGPGQTVTGVTSVGGSVYVASYKPDNSLRWVHRIGSGYGSELGGFAVTPAGTAVVNGDAYGTIKVSTAYGERQLPSHGGIDVFLVSFTGDDGHIQFARTDGGTGADYAADLALDGYGGVVEVGSFTQQATFGTAPASTTLTSLGFSDGFVASFTSGGALRFARDNAPGGSNSDTQTVVIGGGAVYVAGAWTGSITLGATTVSSAGSGYDFYLERLDPATGDPGWVRLVKRTQSGTPYSFLRQLTYSGGVVHFHGTARSTVGFSVPGNYPTKTFTPDPVPQDFVAAYGGSGYLLAVAAA